jgi:poly(3-hydroxybutyrate) depolymerase
MMSNLRLSAKARALRGSGLLALLATVILLACSSGLEDGLPSGKAGSSAGGTAAGGAAGSPSTGGVISTGGVVGVAGSAGSAAGNVASMGGTGGLGGGGQATGGTGSMAGGSSGGSPGTGGSGAVRSSGCGKASTLTFGAAPNGTGAGGSLKIGNRNFILRLPDNYDMEKPYWLIFGFHWRGGSANDVDSGGSNKYNMAHYGLQKLSKNGAIFVAPDGLGGGWANSGDEDLKFVDDMVKLIEDNYCVDTKRLYANGFSYGGGMSYALACARADVFRAVGIYDGAVLSGCKGGTQPIAYWQMHGLTDGTLGIGPARSMRDQFVENNGCTAQTPPEPPQPPPYLVNGGHICTSYSGCSSGHPLRWCAHQSGHGNAVVDGTDDLFHRCANPGMTCSDTCRCSWVPEDVWTFFNSL